MIEIEMGKNKAQSMAQSKGGASGKNQSHQKRQNNHAIKKNVAPKTNERDNEKIHYVLNPKKIKERLVEAKQKEHREKEKSYQKQKRKRNSAFLRTTKKGQPILNARMKILYSQIQKSYGNGSGT